MKLENIRWLKMKDSQAAAAESFLRMAEDYYVSACSRFIERDTANNKVWVLGGKNSAPCALLIHSKGSLLPVFYGKTEIPAPGFLYGFFNTIRIYSVQGLKKEAIALEKELEKTGKKAFQSIDFDLMAINNAPNMECYSAGPPNLVFRKPEFTDLDALAVLQAAYEREEVLPSGTEFSPAASRKNIETIVGKSKILVAQLNGRIVGKINVNAVSFTKVQVGGIYVHPDFRGRGIASRMIAQFIGPILAGGNGVNLFVKKSNTAARRLYERAGFSVKGDYRVSYYYS